MGGIRHDEKPVNWYDTDHDGITDEGEVLAGAKQGHGYYFVSVTPITFVRWIGPQIASR